MRWRARHAPRSRSIENATDECGGEWCEQAETEERQRGQAGPAAAAESPSFGTHVFEQRRQAREHRSQVRAEQDDRNKEENPGACRGAARLRTAFAVLSRLLERSSWIFDIPCDIQHAMVVRGEVARGSAIPEQGVPSRTPGPSAAVRHPCCPLASVAGALVLWEVVVRTGPVSENDLPAMSTTMQELWSLMKTGEFWKDFAYTVRGWALGLGDRDGARRADRDRARLERPGRARAPGSDRVPAADSSAALIPLLFLTIGTIVEERGLPGCVRRVLAAARADDLRRPRRRPGGDRHGALVRARALRAPLPHHAAERDAVHRDRPADRVDRLADPRASPPSSSWGRPASGQAMNYAQSYGLNDQLYALALATGFLGLAVHFVMVGARAARAALASVRNGAPREPAALQRVAKIGAEISCRWRSSSPGRCGRCTRDSPNFPRLSTILVEFQRHVARSRSSTTHVGPEPRADRPRFRDRRRRRCRARDPDRLSSWTRKLAMPHIEYWRAMPPPALCCRSRSSCCTTIGNTQKVAFIALLLHVPGPAEHDRRRARASTRRSSTRCAPTASRGASAIRRIVLPGALPQIVAGMRTSLALAVIMMVLAEYFSSTNGVGYVLADLEEHLRARADVGGDPADRPARLPAEPPLPARRATARLPGTAAGAHRLL